MNESYKSKSNKLTSKEKIIISGELVLLFASMFWLGSSLVTANENVHRADQTQAAAVATIDSNNQWFAHATEAFGERMGNLYGTATAQAEDPNSLSSQIHALPEGIWDSVIDYYWKLDATKNIGCSANLITFNTIRTHSGKEIGVGLLSTISHCIENSESGASLPEELWIKDSPVKVEGAIDISQKTYIGLDKAILIGFSTENKLETLKPNGINNLGCDLEFGQPHYFVGVTSLDNGVSIPYAKKVNLIGMVADGIYSFDSGLYHGASGGGFFNKNGCLVSVTKSYDPINGYIDKTVQISPDASHRAEEFLQKIIDRIKSAQ